MVPTDASGTLPIVGIPLQVDDRPTDRPIGVIAIYCLLQYKADFTLLDHELFALLARHAATAILASCLHS
jgi:hypothetical protein